MTCRTCSAGCPAPYRRRCTDRDTKIADFYLYLAAALVTVRLLAEIRLLDHRRFSTDKVEKVAQQNRVRGGLIHRPVGQRPEQHRAFLH